MSSFSAMDKACALASHGSWNHELPCHAPQPHEPEASDVILRLGRWDGGGRKEMPFHVVMNEAHHARSERNPWLSLITGCDGRTACNRSIIRRKKDLPDLTTLQAWLRRPIRDSSSVREQADLSPHCCSRARSRWSFSSGRRTSPASESISMPKIIRHVVGPSRLWAAIGISKVEHT